VSLKSKLAAKDLHRLLSDVRKKVEREVTFDGTDRRTRYVDFQVKIYFPHDTESSFVSVLFPPTPETIQHVLIQGGFQQTRIDCEDSAFTVLLEETRSVFASSDFSSVLQTCLDQAAQTLFAHLESKVFVDSASSQEDVRVRLAGLLPGLAGWSLEAMRGVPNELVDVSAFLQMFGVRAEWL
jgi:peroxin-3